MADMNDDNRRRRLRRRNLITFGVLAAVSFGFYLGIYWRWIHHPPVTPQSTAAAAARMGNY